MLGSKVFQCPTKYVQSPGLLSFAGDIVSQSYPRLCKPGIIICGRVPECNFRTPLLESFGKDAQVYEYNGDCTRAGVAAVAAQFRKAEVDHVVAFGGGKLLDTGKLVSDELDSVSVIMPSIASTDAPCTSLGVLYTEDGEFDAYQFLRHSPDFVLVDSDIILNAPARFLVSGMASNLVPPFIHRPGSIAVAVSKQCRDDLFLYGVEALHSVQTKVTMVTAEVALVAALSSEVAVVTVLSSEVAVVTFVTVVSAEVEVVTVVSAEVAVVTGVSAEVAGVTVLSSKVAVVTVVLAEVAVVTVVLAEVAVVTGVSAEMVVMTVLSYKVSVVSAEAEFMTVVLAEVAVATVVTVVSAEVAVVTVASAEVHSQALEFIIEANILLSGLGAESGGLAAAHAIHNGLVFLPESHGMLHGEKVAFGTIAQLFLEGELQEAHDVIDFCIKVGLPTCFRDLGIEINNEKLKLIAQHCMGEGTSAWNMGPVLTEESLITAMIEADAAGMAAKGYNSDAPGMATKIYDLYDAAALANGYDSDDAGMAANGYESDGAFMSGYDADGACIFDGYNSDGADIDAKGYNTHVLTSV
eukprot:gene26052-11752_t